MAVLTHFRSESPPPTLAFSHQCVCLASSTTTLIVKDLSVGPKILSSSAAYQVSLDVISISVNWPMLLVLPSGTTPAAVDVLEVNPGLNPTQHLSHKSTESPSGKTGWIKGWFWDFISSQCQSTERLLLLGADVQRDYVVLYIKMLLQRNMLSICMCQLLEQAEGFHLSYWKGSSTV